MVLLEEINDECSDLLRCTQERFFLAHAFCCLLFVRERRIHGAESYDTEIAGSDAPDEILRSALGKPIDRGVLRQSLRVA